MYKPGLLRFLTKVVKTQARKETTVAVSNTTTETEVFSETLLSSTIGTEKALRVKMFGECLNNTGGAQDIKFYWYLGSTTLATMVVNLATSGGNRAVSFEGTLMGHDSLASQKSVAMLVIGGTSTTTGTSAAAHSVNLCTQTNSTENAATDLLLRLTCKFDTASASLNFNHWGSTLEVV